MTFSLKTAILTLALTSSAFLMPSAQAASLWSDPAFVQRQAELVIAQTAGKAAQDAVIATRNSDALSSASCTELATARKTSALQFYKRGQPPDPSNIIQNTTCFIDISAIKIPVSLTGIGFLDGLISGFATKMLNNSCGKLGSFITDLKNSALSQIGSVVGSTTGGSLNLGQLNAGLITVNIGGQLITLDPNLDNTAILQAAGNTLGNQAIQAATDAISQSTYDAINGTMDPNAGAAADQALAEYKQVQCQANGVGANETCPCPTAASLPGGVQSVYPQCTSTYQPWYYNGGGGGP